MVHVGRHARRWGAYAALGIVAALIASAHCGAQPQTGHANKHAHHDRGGATDMALRPPAPIIVQVQPSAQEVEAVANQEAANRRIFWLEPDAWVAVFTLTLTITTAFMWEATHRAAKVAERALVDLERPYIFIWGISGVQALRDDGYKPRIYYNVSNNGKLAARVDDVSIRFGGELNGQFPALAVQGDHELLQEPIFSSDENRKRLFHAVSDSPLVTRGNPNTHFGEVPHALAVGTIFGVVIKYRGPSGEHHETAQCWRSRTSPDGWVEIADSELTYMK